MRLNRNRKVRIKFDIPKDTYDKLGSQEKTVELLKTGLLSLKVALLEKEIVDLTEKIRESKKLIAELPSEIESLQELLREAVKDRKVLETLLDKKE
ncbi:MAG: hypothetical protein QXN36_08550 [Candidatus Bathyarchaeia archaeon]